MYGNILITPELVRQQMEETQKIYEDHPLLDAHWYKFPIPQSLFRLSRKPQAVVIGEETCECEAC